MPLPAALAPLVQSLRPGSRIVSVTPLGPDRETDDAVRKAIGYGAPVRIDLVDSSGEATSIVLHLESANDFGHDRRSDRARSILEQFDDFGRVPRHVVALDVGAVTRNGELTSLRDWSELYLVTQWAEGTLYAEDLRAIARRGEVVPGDLERCDALVRTLCEIHSERGPRRAIYTRAIRDLVGNGEGIFGMVDGYPADAPAAPPARLCEIERRSVEWRWRLRDRHERLRRTHGDFHPFNVIFGASQDPTLLDASRGAWGDPADDVACMALNYVFFALQATSAGAWSRGLGALWRRFWEGYLARSGDAGILDVAAPFLAWRGLVMASPRWYPAVTFSARDRLLGLVERALDSPRFEPSWADELF
ncbi:MAG: aminoglycoside phosphotransferase family protein [Deltaproteobacteria bacterium]|nr:aminoglycoside phosphotransferase family protein [Deltaproteobacteria bacterium]